MRGAGAGKGLSGPRVEGEWPSWVNSPQSLQPAQLHGGWGSTGSIQSTGRLAEATRGNRTRSPAGLAAAQGAHTHGERAAEQGAGPGRSAAAASGSPLRCRRSWHTQRPDRTSTEVRADTTPSSSGAAASSTRPFRCATQQGQARAGLWEGGDGGIAPPWRRPRQACQGGAW